MCVCAEKYNLITLFAAFSLKLSRYKEQFPSSWKSGRGRSKHKQEGRPYLLSLPKIFSPVLSIDSLIYLFNYI